MYTGIIKVGARMFMMNRSKHWLQLKNVLVLIMSIIINYFNTSRLSIQQ